MKLVLLLLVLTTTCAASNLEILAAPAGLKFPDAGSSTLKTNQISTLNENILGLSAKEVDGFPISMSLFSRPRALAVITVVGTDDLSFGGQTFATQSNGLKSDSGFDQDMALIFGADRESVQTTVGGITGSKMALLAQQEQIDFSTVKTKRDTLRRELENVYKLAAAIKNAGVQMDNNADVFRVSITGLVGITDPTQLQEAKSDVTSAIQALTQAMNNSYGGQAVVELLTFEAETSETPEASEADGREIPDSMDSEEHRLQKRSPDFEFQSQHRIQKRDVTVQGWIDALLAVRKEFNVSKMVSTDYPAIFAIFAGLTILLVVSLIYIIVAMAQIDPEKDSIIYRMTTTRMKKD